MNVGRSLPNDEAEPGTHSCPGCGIRLKHFERYPWYFCQGCLEQAEDCEGKRLVFFNISIGGGLGWRYADDPSTADRNVVEVICFICARPVLVMEARFGGVVAQPLTGDRPGLPVAGMSVDLTDVRNLGAARKKTRTNGDFMDRRLISTGSPFEKTAGYSRAVVQGDWCFVAGTTGYDYATMTMPDSVEDQARNCLATICRALAEGGFALEDVVRAHYYITDRSYADIVFPILGETFGDIRPAATMIVCLLNKPEMKIEIEVTALRRTA